MTADALRIVRLEAEGILRLHAVSIKPDGSVTELTGKNANGKTSVLNSIYMALAGAGAIPSDPINHSAESAVINLDMGAIKVTRTFKRKDASYTTSLKVEGADGASYKSPQSMLDALLSSLSFDPLEFSRMKPKQQFDALRSLVPGVDFEQIDNLNRGDFQRRTDENKRCEEAKAAAGLIAIPTDLPDDEVSEADLLDTLQKAAQHNADLVDENKRRMNVAMRAKACRDNGEAARKKAETHRKLAAELDVEGETNEKEAAQLLVDLEKLEPIAAPTDVAQVRLDLEKAQAINQRIRKAAEERRRKTSLEKVATDAAMRADELTAKLKARDKAKAEAIAAVKMPIKGLGFGEGFVTLHGVPFEQASSAEQLSASIAISMSRNSKLKVILIRDGSLLDADSWEILGKLADENGFQVFCESVFPHSAAAIVIEDGRIKGAQREAEESQESAA